MCSAPGFFKRHLTPSIKGHAAGFASIPKSAHHLQPRPFTPLAMQQRITGL